MIRNHLLVVAWAAWGLVLFAWAWSYRLADDPSFPRPLRAHVQHATRYWMPCVLVLTFSGLLVYTVYHAG